MEVEDSCLLFCSLNISLISTQAFGR